MINIILQSYHISKGHYNAALEHCSNYGLEHKPTMLQAFITTLSDYILNKTIYCKESKSYVVYEKVNKRTIGLKANLVVAMYTPKELRGQGYVSKLLDNIDGVVIVPQGEDENEVGRLYARRKIL